MRTLIYKDVKGAVSDQRDWIERFEETKAFRVHKNITGRKLLAKYSMSKSIYFPAE